MSRSLSSTVTNEVVPETPFSFPSVLISFCGARSRLTSWSSHITVQFGAPSSPLSLSPMSSPSITDSAARSEEPAELELWTHRCWSDLHCESLTCVSPKLEGHGPNASARRRLAQSSSKTLTVKGLTQKESPASSLRSGDQSWKA